LVQINQCGLKYYGFISYFFSNQSEAFVIQIHVLTEIKIGKYFDFYMKPKFAEKRGPILREVGFHVQPGESRSEAQTAKSNSRVRQIDSWPAEEEREGRERRGGFKFGLLLAKYSQTVCKQSTSDNTSMNSNSSVMPIKPIKYRCK